MWHIVWHGPIRWALPALLLLAACGGSAAPKVAPAPTQNNTQAAADEARVACRFYVPDSVDRAETQKFVDHAFTAARLDSRWQPLSDAADSFQSAQRSFAGLVQAITDADTACKEVP